MLFSESIVKERERKKEINQYYRIDCDLYMQTIACSRSKSD